MTAHGDNPDRNESASHPAGIDDAMEVENPEKRIISGIPRLDYILKGGLLQNGVYAIFGPRAVAKPSLRTSSASTRRKARAAAAST